MDIIKVLKDWIAAVDKGEEFVRSYAESHGVGMVANEKEFTVSFVRLEQPDSLQQERDELIEIILTDGDLSAGMLADVIINAGYRKPED